MRNPKEHAHALLDMLPEEKLTAVVGLLEVMVEPLSRSLASAPMEEEEITPDTAAALERARASLARGEGIPTKTCSASSVHDRTNQTPAHRRRLGARGHLINRIRKRPIVRYGFAGR